MKLTLRAALLAGALVASSGAALAESINLAQALVQGAEQSPRIAQARALAQAAEARARQAGAPPNPELSVEVENFAGTGMFQGFGGSVAKIVKLEHAWRRLDGRNDDGFQVAPFPG